MSQPHIYIRSERETLVGESCGRVRCFCDPVDFSPPGSSVRGSLQARTLQWVPFPAPGDLPDPGIKPAPPASQVGTWASQPQGPLFLGFPPHSGRHRAGSRVPCAAVSLTSHVFPINSECSSVSASRPPPRHPFGVHMFVLSVCVSISAFQVRSLQPSSQSHVDALIDDTYVSPSDLFHSVSSSLGPSTSQKLPA